MNLQYRMILDYTARVERLHLGKHPTKLTVDVANYIQHHMSELITAEKIAEEAHDFCPYSRATRGNIDVEVQVV